MSGQHQEAAKMLDFQNYFLDSQEPEILEGKVVASSQDQSEQRKRPRKKPKHAHKEEKEGEVNYMMPLSSMNMQNLLEIWNNRWLQLGKETRPLKEIVKAPPSNEVKRWGSKGIAEHVKKIRAILTVCELLRMHNVEDPINKVEEWRKSEGWSMDGLGRRIQDKLSEMEVSTSGKTTTASAIFKHDNYDPTTCLWKHLI